MWKKTIAPALVVSLCWIVVGGATSWYLSFQDRALDKVLAENVASIRAANEMEATVWKMQSAALEAARDRAHAEPELQASLENSFRRSLREAASAATVDAEVALLNDIGAAFDSYAVRWRQTGGSRVVDPEILSELLLLTPQIIDPCEQLMRINEQLMHRASQKRQAMTAWVVFGRATMLVIGPGLGLLLGFRLAGQLHRSITRISVRLQAVAGDLEQEVGRLEVSPQADLPAVQRQLDVIADRMHVVVQDLQQARRETMRAERLAAVGELAAGVAHELRNPLTSVKLLIQTMQHRFRDNMPPQTIEIVLEEISRMESTIQGLLDFAGPPRLQRARHDLRQIVRRAVNLTEGKARQHGVALAAGFSPEPVWVNGDAEQLHQVCINLLLNGIDSMTLGGAFDICVEVNETALAAIVRFEDSGAGIPDSILPRLFEPFVTSKDCGTGLGLAISRRIVTGHSGRLFADNRIQGGACLTMELPLDQELAPHEGPHAHAVVG